MTSSQPDPSKPWAAHVERHVGIPRAKRICYPYWEAWAKLYSALAHVDPSAATLERRTIGNALHREWAYHAVDAFVWAEQGTSAFWNHPSSVPSFIGAVSATAIVETLRFVDRPNRRTDAKLRDLRACTARVMTTGMRLLGRGIEFTPTDPALSASMQSLADRPQKDPFFLWIARQPTSSTTQLTDAAANADETRSPFDVIYRDKPEIRREVDRLIDWFGKEGTIGMSTAVAISHVLDDALGPPPPPPRNPKAILLN